MTRTILKSIAEEVLKGRPERELYSTGQEWYEKN